MSIVRELESIINRLASGKEKESVCEEARRFLSSVDPASLRTAEQQLSAKGISVENLHNPLFVIDKKNSRPFTCK